MGLYFLLRQIVKKSNNALIQCLCCSSDFKFMCRLKTGFAVLWLYYFTQWLGILNWSLILIKPVGISVQTNTVTKQVHPSTGAHYYTKRLFNSRCTYTSSQSKKKNQGKNWEERKRQIKEINIKDRFFDLTTFAWSHSSFLWTTRIRSKEMRFNRQKRILFSALLSLPNWSAHNFFLNHCVVAVIVVADEIP